MKTYFAAALISAGAQAVNLQQNILLDSDELKGYAQIPYDYGFDYLKGNFPGGASIHTGKHGGGLKGYGGHGLDYHNDYLHGTSGYPARDLVGYGPGGYGYGASYGQGLYGYGYGNGRYL